MATTGKPDRPALIGSAVFGCVGLALITLGASLMFNGYKLTREGREVSGTLVDFSKRESKNAPYRDSRGITYSHRGFLVQFTTDQGKTIEFMSRYEKPSGNAVFSDPIYDVGDKVPVLYLPSNPNTAELKTPFLLWGDGLVVAILGMIFVLGGLGVYFAFGRSSFP